MEKDNEIPEWCTKLGNYLIEEIQIYYGNEIVYNSKKDINIYQEMGYEKNQDNPQLKIIGKKQKSKKKNN
jgi:hypothetical protein